MPSRIRRGVVSFINWLLWLTLRSCGVEPSLEEVRNRIYDRRAALPALEELEVSETLRHAVEAELEVAQARRRAVDEKARMLLTLTGLLIPFTSLLGARLPCPELAVIPLLLFLISAALLIAYLSVGRSMAPNLSAEEMAFDEERLQKQLIVDQVQSRQFMDGATDFLVDVYRAALRSLFVGFIAAAIMLCIAFLRAGDESERFREQLRNDPELLELLRGPAGPPGPPGPEHPPAPSTLIPSLNEPPVREEMQELSSPGASDSEESASPAGEN